ncbi:MAG: hypothetical protein QXW47_07690 [Candidatus Jordarchaeales archaeon]|nr:hypothetical protein [Candidatus Jordarchaeia archaeon]
MKAAASLLRAVPKQVREVYAILGCRPGKVERRVLLTATRIATRRAVRLLEKAERRGETFHGYYGGVAISIVHTGIGCPATAVALEALHRAGVRVVVRSDFAGAVKENIKLGDLIVAERAFTGDGTSKRYINEAIVEGSRDVTSVLFSAALSKGWRTHLGSIWTTDVFFREMEDLRRAVEAGCIGIDMETAALFAVCSIYGVKCGAIVAVSDKPIEGKDFFDCLGRKVIDGLDHAVETALEALSELEV